LCVALSVFVLTPAVTSASASPEEDPERQILQQQMELATQQNVTTTTVVQNTYVHNSNCEDDAQPFLTGTVKNTNANPVAGASVSIRVLGITTPNPSDMGTLYVGSTGADGTYEICHEDTSTTSWLSVNNGGDVNGRYAIIGLASPSSQGSGDSLSSNIALHTSFQSSPIGSNDCLTATGPTNLICTFDFVLGPADVSGTIIDPDGRAIPSGRVFLDFFYQGVSWVQLGEIQSNMSGFFGLSGFTNSNTFRVRVQRPYCELSELEMNAGARCPFESLSPISDGFNVSTAANVLIDAKWASNDTSNRVFQLDEANFGGFITNSFGYRINSWIDVVASSGSTVLNESTTYVAQQSFTQRSFCNFMNLHRCALRYV
jgi:hypothetical protein